jgi:hypothetical protein
MTTLERFNNKWIPEPYSGCWLWTACLDKRGYGKVKANSKYEAAHRLSWKLHRGDTNGLHVCHKCDTPACVNPDHLFLGTNLENHQDSSRKGRSSRGEKRSNAKLTSDQVIAIRDDPRTLMEIAADYGMHFAYISLIKARKRWGWLQCP